ncbi:MAG: hypothetical protein GX622_04210 [Bacteroidales bacterium]|nr:hypothetical protein [Bacteroidales bacterium]
MKKAIIVSGVIALALAGCTGKAAKEAEKARAAEITKVARSCRVRFDLIRC